MAIFLKPGEEGDPNKRLVRLEPRTRGEKRIFERDGKVWVEDDDSCGPTNIEIVPKGSTLGRKMARFGRLLRKAGRFMLRCKDETDRRPK